MNELVHIQAREMAVVMKALGHPVRVRIMELLAEARWNVSELAEEIEMDMSSISKHLSILRNAGLTYPDKEGTRTYYFTYCKCIPKFQECVKGLMETVINRRRKILNP